MPWLQHLVHVMWYVGGISHDVVYFFSHVVWLFDQVICKKKK